MRPMAARGEVRVTVSFGPTSSPALAHAVSYAIEHAWRTEELRRVPGRRPFGLDQTSGSSGSFVVPFHGAGVEDHQGGGRGVDRVPPDGDLHA